jgi:hypothetical protein
LHKDKAAAKTKPASEQGEDELSWIPIGAEELDPSLIRTDVLPDATQVTTTPLPAAEKKPAQKAQLKTGGKPQEQVITGDLPAAQAKISYKPQDQVITGDQPAAQVKSAGKPQDQVTTGDQPAASLKTSYKPQDQVITGDQPAAQVKSAGKPRDQVTTGEIEAAKTDDQPGAKGKSESYNENAYQDNLTTYRRLIEKILGKGWE